VAQEYGAGKIGKELKGQQDTTPNRISTKCNCTLGFLRLVKGTVAQEYGAGKIGTALKGKVPLNQDMNQMHFRLS
jgi:hypothetical protein